MTDYEPLTAEPRKTWDLPVVGIHRMIDGDTCILIVDQGFDTYSRITVRVLGVNTPERSAEGFEEATEAARAWMQTRIDGETLRLVSLKRLSFARWLGQLYTEGASEDTLGAYLVEHGYGVLA